MSLPEGSSEAEACDYARQTERLRKLSQDLTTLLEMGYSDFNRNYNLLLYLPIEDAIAKLSGEGSIAYSLDILEQE